MLFSLLYVMNVMFAVNTKIFSMKVKQSSLSMCASKTRSPYELCRIQNIFVFVRVSFTLTTGAYEGCGDIRKKPI